MSQAYWNKSHENCQMLYEYDMEPRLMGLSKKVKKGTILDIGYGSGRNLHWFASHGYHVQGIELSDVAHDKMVAWSKKEGYSLDLQVGNILDIDLESDKYSLIICSWVLNFFKKSDVDKIINKLQDALCPGGYLYVGVFGDNDPTFKTYTQTHPLVEENTFYLSERESYCFLPDKAYFHSRSSLSLVAISEEEFVEPYGKRRLRGIIEYVGRKDD